jgi:hypothetical protein
MALGPRDSWRLFAQQVSLKWAPVFAESPQLPAANRVFCQLPCRPQFARSAEHSKTLTGKMESRTMLRLEDLL